MVASGHFLTIPYIAESKCLGLAQTCDLQRTQPGEARCAYKRRAHRAVRAAAPVLGPGSTVVLHTTDASLSRQRINPVGRPQGAAGTGSGIWRSHPARAPGAGSDSSFVRIRSEP